jgi:hypothetical protein
MIKENERESMVHNRWLDLADQSRKLNHEGGEKQDRIGKRKDEIELADEHQKGEKKKCIKIQRQE